MGSLEYNSSRPPIDVEDTLLAHLKIVISTKLRRQESLMMPRPPAKKSPAPLSARMHPAIPLVLEFDADPVPAIDPARVSHMMERLNARGELLIDEFTS